MHHFLNNLVKCLKIFGRISRIARIAIIARIVRIARIVIIIIISHPSDYLLGESMAKHKPYIVIRLYPDRESLDSRKCKTTERHDAMVVSCITKRQKAALDVYCWQNRVSQSEIVRNMVENLLTTSEMKT